MSADPDRQRQWLARKGQDREAHAYRSFVGPPHLYDVMGALQFTLLIHLGLRESHYLLDIGCGSLRAGRLLIPYLLPGHYCGIEPERWLVAEGIRCELGEDVREVKRPRFSDDGSFTLGVFDQTFDFIVAHSIFSHASQDQIRRCLAEAPQVMTRESLFVATIVPGAESYEGDEWVYCAPYTLERVVALAGEQGLECRPFEWPHPNSQRWLLFRPKGVAWPPLPAPLREVEHAGGGQGPFPPAPEGGLARVIHRLRRAWRPG